MTSKNAVALALEDKKYVLEFVQWQDTAGTFKYAYIVMKKNTLPVFKQALAKGPVNVADFGIVVAQGSGNDRAEGLDDAVIASLSAGHSQMTDSV